MALVSELMGVGFAPAQARKIGFIPTAVTAAGTTQASATNYPLESHHALVTSTTGATGVVMQTAFELANEYFVSVLSSSTVTGVVYCPVSGTLNGTTNAGLSISPGKSALFVQTAQSVWVSILSA